jgi:hypothetical protein
MGISATLADPFPVSTNLDRTVALQELEAILNSPAFRNCPRGKQFLSFVVRYKLDGNNEPLKERVIGTDLFHRRVDYSTGDDPIVRVQAGEVRRRLEQHYKVYPNSSAIRIELPLGSYVPEFRSASADVQDQVQAEPHYRRRRIFRWVAAVVGVALVATLVAIRVEHAVPPLSLLGQFWAPVLSTSRPVLVCLSKPVLYRPSMNLYRRYQRSHPGTFQIEVERLNQYLPLEPNENVPWRDMSVFPDFGVGSGDVYAGFRISGLLSRMNKENQLRIGNESSFDELRSSPAVMVGAFSNRWTLEMTSNLRFVFSEKDALFWIQDRTIPDRKWFTRLGQRGEVTEDYGIATRLLDSKTGQLVITLAGITAPGSDAAAQLVSNQDYLTQGLRSAPGDWKKKNMQFVVKTQVVDFVAGPPQVVASYFW